MQDFLVLNDGRRIPRLGLGVWQARGGDETRAVRHAISVGYRHIDTAAIYDNEVGVGEGLRASGVERDALFVTSKVWTTAIRAGRTLAAVDESLARLGLESLDLMLLHWPAEGRVQAWRDLIAAREAGKVRSIGVSNFLPAQLDELVQQTGVVPAINQIEHHPWLRQREIVDATRRHGIALQAWSPLMKGRLGEEPVIGEIARAVGRTEAQVVLRWALQHGFVVIPKSVTPARIEENAAVFDFELDREAMQRIDGIRHEQRLGPDPSNFGF